MGSRNEREWHRGIKKNGEKMILQFFDCADSLFELYKTKPSQLKNLSAGDIRSLVSPVKHEIPQKGSHLSHGP